MQKFELSCKCLNVSTNKLPVICLERTRRYKFMGSVQGCLTSLSQNPTKEKALSPLSRTAGSSNSRTVSSPVPSWFLRWPQTGARDPQVSTAVAFPCPLSPHALLWACRGGGCDICCLLDEGPSTSPQISLNCGKSW